MDKLSTKINRYKVQITTGQKTVKKLTRSIEESTREKEKTIAEKDNMIAGFKVVEQKAFVLQENYQKTQEVCSLLLHGVQRHLLLVFIGFRYFRILY